MYNIVYLAGFVQGEDGWVLLTMDEQLRWTYPYCMSFRCPVIPSTPFHSNNLPFRLDDMPHSVILPIPLRSLPIKFSILLLVEMPHSVILYTSCQRVCPLVTPLVTPHTPKGPQHSSWTSAWI